MFQAHLFSYFSVRNCFVWKRFATMRSYDNMFHGFCSTRKCFQQRLISFRSVLSDTTQELYYYLYACKTVVFIIIYSSIELTFVFDRTDFWFRSKRPSIETTFNCKLQHSYFLQYSIDMLNTIASWRKCRPLFSLTALSVGHDELLMRLCFVNSITFFSDVPCDTGLIHCTVAVH